MDSKKYTFKGFQYEQGSLTYAEDCAAREVLRKHNGAVPSPEDVAGFSRAINKLWDTEGMPDLFNIILKPVRTWKFWRRVPKASQILQTLDKREIAEVMRDFFVFKQSWIEDFVDSTMTLNSMSELQRLVEDAQRLLKK